MCDYPVGLIASGYHAPKVSIFIKGVNIHVDLQSTLCQISKDEEEIKTNLDINPSAPNQKTTFLVRNCKSHSLQTDYFAKNALPFLLIADIRDSSRVMKRCLDWHSISYICKGFYFPATLRQSQVPQRATEQRAVCADAVWDAGVTRHRLTGQGERAQQLRGRSGVISGGSTSGTAADKVGGRNWRRTDRNTSPSPTYDLYLQSTCWYLRLLPYVTLVVAFLGEEFPILLHLLGQPVPVIVKSPGTMQHILLVSSV